MTPPVTYGGGGPAGDVIVGGENPTDAFRINIRFPETIAALLDAMSVAFTFPDTVGVQTDAVKADIRGLGDTNDSLSDLLTRLNLTHADTIALPTDASTYALNFATSDTVAAQTETVKANIRGLGDTIALSTDAQRGTATWLQGATTAAGANWSTPANAQGLRNDTLSTLSDSAAAQTSGTLTLDPYPDPDASFSSWTISTVKLRFFVKGVFSALTTSTLKLEWRIGAGAWTTLETLSTNFDNLAAGSPRIHDVTAGVGGSWANVNGLQTRAVYTAALLVETATIDMDAVEIEVVATKDPI